MALLVDPRSETLTQFLMQFFLVIVATRTLARAIRRLRQPLVIGEVFGGVILGPSVCGWIPGWTATFFPTESLPFFGLVANVGLIFFMFYLGLEVDPGLMRRQWKIG